jgi:hypothetical protein
MRMFQKGLPVKLGKSPNEKTKPVITIHKKYPNNEATKGQQPKTNQALEPQVPNAQLPTPSLPPVISTCRSRMYLPYLDCISVNISYESRIINQYRARHSYKKSLQGTHTQDTIIHVTTLPHRGRVGPPPPKGVAKTSNTDIQQKKRNLPTHPLSGKRGSRCGFLLRGV